MSENKDQLQHLDATTFQEPLGKLAEVIAQKVNREASKILKHSYVATDLYVLMRQMLHTYALLFYLNADDRRQNDCYWRTSYSIVTLPLIRNMIDGLYNITVILENPSVNGPWFRKSGFRKALNALDEDNARYGGQEKWDVWIEKNRQQIDLEIRSVGLTMAEVLSQQLQWPTMGKYVSDKGPGGTITSHQYFLKTFVLGPWREYSAMAHGAFEGLRLVGMYFIADSFPHDLRPKVEETHPQVLAMHIGRAAGVLLCTITELQAYFHFDGADINKRIHEMWAALMQVFEVKELYDERYAQLMKDQGIFT